MSGPLYGLEAVGSAKGGESRLFAGQAEDFPPECLIQEKSRPFQQHQDSLDLGDQTRLLGPEEQSDGSDHFETHAFRKLARLEIVQDDPVVSLTGQSNRLRLPIVDDHGEGCHEISIPGCQESKPGWRGAKFLGNRRGRPDWLQKSRQQVEKGYAFEGDEAGAVTDDRFFHDPISSRRSSAV